MGKDRVDNTKIDNYTFKIKPVEEKDKKLYMDFRIEFKEVSDVINEMKEASPGPNGLTLGFYKKYFKHFWDIFSWDF